MSPLATILSSTISFFGIGSRPGLPAGSTPGVQRRWSHRAQPDPEQTGATSSSPSAALPIPASPSLLQPSMLENIAGAGNFRFNGRRSPTASMSDSHPAAKHNSQTDGVTFSTLAQRCHRQGQEQRRHQRSRRQRPFARRIRNTCYAVARATTLRGGAGSDRRGEPKRRHTP